MVKFDPKRLVGALMSLGLALAAGMSFGTGGGGGGCWSDYYLDQFSVCFYTGTNGAAGTFISAEWESARYTPPYPSLTAIDRDWSEGEPIAGGYTSDVSGVWKGSFHFENGWYDFAVMSDDGVRAYIDDVPVLDQWQVQDTTFNLSQHMTEGYHRIRVEWFASPTTPAHAGLRLHWDKVFATCPSDMFYGETALCSIDTPNEVDQTFFTGTSGERVFVKMVRESGDINPRIEIYRPDGSQLCAGATNGDNVIRECTLDATGVHLMRLSDNGSNGTGAYSVHLQRTNSPANARAVSFGQTVTSSISLGAETHAYTVPAAPADRIFLKGVRESGSVNPVFRAYRPDGSVMCTAGLSAGSSGGDVAGDCAVDAGGTITVLFGDASGLPYVGGYSAHIQRTNNPGNATPFAYGETLTGALSLGAETRAYTVSAGAGDRLHLEGERDSGSFNPVFRVYRPDGP